MNVHLVNNQSIYLLLLDKQLSKPRKLLGFTYDQC